MKFKIFALFAVLLGILSGCSSDSTPEEKYVENRMSGEFFDSMYASSYIIKDNDTNCKYLVVTESRTGGGNGLSTTPLLKADGTPDCGEKQ